nr:hypothetical protein [Tanacetum cinerariifolium]
MLMSIKFLFCLIIVAYYFYSGYQYIFQRRVSEPTGSSRHDESPYTLLGQSDSEEELEMVVLGADEDREHMDLDVAGVSPQPSTEQLDEGFTATAYLKVQESLKLVIKEHVLLEELASSSGTLSSLQHMSKDINFGDLFFSDRPSDVDKNAETEVESMVNVPIQQAMSSISLMTSPIIDLTLRPESPKEHQQFKATTTDTTTTITTTLPPPQAPQQSNSEAMMIQRIGELEHIMANLIQVNKDMEERLDKHGARLYTLEQLDIPQQVSIAVSEVVMDAVDWAMQAPLQNRFRDLPEADIKEILHQRMWETESYKTHEDHTQLFEALEKLMNRDHYKELAQDLAEVRKKKKKGRESPKTPPGSPPPPPPPVGSAAPSSSKTTASAEYQAWTTTDFRLRPSISLTPADLEMDEDMGLDEQAQLSDDENIGSAHIPKVNLRQDRWKPLEEERPATLEPAWSIPSSDTPVPLNNWASALASNYSPPPKDSLPVQTGDMATFIDWFCKRRGITELKPQDLEGPAFEIIKVFHRNVIHHQYQMEECHKLLTDNIEYLRYGSKGSRPALSISKMKAAYYLDAGLEQLVSNQFWIDEECTYDIAAMYGISHWWFQRQRFYIDRHTSKGDRSAVRTHMRILSVVRIEVFSMYGYEYMKKIVLRRADLNEHVIAERDFKAVIFQDKYEVQMMMRFNEIHKFSDGTLQQIDEEMDYRVKEFRINRMNPGLKTRFWTRKDVDRCKAFMFAIQRHLRTRRIFRNLESFVGGHVREGDYRLLKRTE